MLESYPNNRGLPSAAIVLAVGEGAPSTPVPATFVMSLGERGGGAENMLWNVLRHLDRAVVEPSVVFLRPGPFEREVAELGIATRVIELGRYRQVARNIGTTVRLAAHLRATRPAVVVDWLARAHLYGGPAAWLAGRRRRVVFWQHMLPEGWQDRWVAALPTAAVGTSSNGVRHAQERVWPRRPVFTVHPGIELPEALPEARVDALRRELRVPGDATVLGIVARLQPWKGQHLFLEVVAALRERGHQVHGVVVGGDSHGFAPDYPPLLRRRASELGVAESVTFTGHVEDPRAHLQLLDVLVNCCAREPFGIAMVEAMALGVPVVALRAPGPLEIVRPGETGDLADDVKGLADAVERLVADPDLRRERGAAAARDARERFTAERMCRELESRLLEVAR